MIRGDEKRKTVCVCVCVKVAAGRHNERKRCFYRDAFEKFPPFSQEESQPRGTVISGRRRVIYRSNRLVGASTRGDHRSRVPGRSLKVPETTCPTRAAACSANNADRRRRRRRVVWTNSTSRRAVTVYANDSTVFRRFLFAELLRTPVEAKKGTNADRG